MQKAIIVCRYRVNFSYTDVEIYLFFDQLLWSFHYVVLVIVKSNMTINVMKIYDTLEFQISSFYQHFLEIQVCISLLHNKQFKHLLFFQLFNHIITYIHCLLSRQENHLR